MRGFRPALDWGSPNPGREVWYGVVTDRNDRLAFWYRYTLVSTKSGYGEGRVWASVTHRDGEDYFMTERLDVDAVEVGLEELSFRNSVLTAGSSSGDIRGEDVGVGWELSYRRDDVVFTPLRSRLLTGFAVQALGASRHWSYNQSVEVDGSIEVHGDGVGDVELEGAAGHHGHTAGSGMPEGWTWMHSNLLDGVAVEALEIDGATSVCFRLGGEAYLLNRLHQVLWRNQSLENRVGVWRFQGRGGDVRVKVEVDAGDWRLARYLAPDETRRYVAHSGLADVDVTYRVGGRQGSATGSGRVEWADTEPPVGSEEDYGPEYSV